VFLSFSQPASNNAIAAASMIFFLITSPFVRLPLWNEHCLIKRPDSLIVAAMESSIPRRQFLHAAAGAATGLALPRVNFGASPNPPNILYIMANRQTVATPLQHSGYQTAIVGNILPYYNPVLIEMGARKQYTRYATDIIANFSLDWLRGRDRKRPFFLMCRHKAPHRPWDPDLKYANRYTGPIPEPPIGCRSLRGIHARSNRGR